MGGTQSTMTASIPAGPCRDGIIPMQNALMTAQEFSDKRVQITALRHIKTVGNNTICQANVQLIDKSTEIVSNVQRDLEITK